MSQYDDIEWMKVYEHVIREQLLKFHKGETTGIPYEVAEEYFPGDIERQVDLCMCIGEALGRAEELGYPAGEVPVNLYLQIARKYKVEKIFDIEVIRLRSGAPSGIIDREVV